MNEIRDTEIHEKPPKHKILPLVLAALSGFVFALLLGGGVLWFIFGRSQTENLPDDVPASSTQQDSTEIGVSSDSIETSEPLFNPDSEVRGVYIATASNINFPSKPGLSAAELKAELDDIVATCVDANLNAIYFQVRPASDALYKSSIFPASKVLSGTQGAPVMDGADEFDPLAYLVKTAHEHNILVHAWVNPLRVTTGSTAYPETDIDALADSNPARLHPEWVVEYADGKLYYDAGIPEVRTLAADGVAEIAENYDVDGIIFDDYFYPYPVYVDGTSELAVFDDGDSYAVYGAGVALDDWRRANVNSLVEACYDAVKAVDPDCEFGVAPFGIWQNDDGTNGGSDTAGLESYSAIYGDPTAWIEGGYLDYIAPQIYWRFTTDVARYDVLVRWWNALLDGSDVDLIISHGVYNYDTWENASMELSQQVEYARSELCYRGSILYGYTALKNDSQGLFGEVQDVFSDEIIYTDVESSGSGFAVSIPYSGSYVDGAGTFVIGTSDPSEPLWLGDEKLSRTKSGYFSVYLPLESGENKFVFTHKGVETEYVINRGVAPSTPTQTVYSQLDSYKIAAVTPSYAWSGSDRKLSVSVTAPSGSDVTAEIGGVSVALTATIDPPDEGDYMTEVYVGTVTLPLASDGAVESVGKIKFTATRGDESATAESAEIRVMGTDATIPVRVLGDDTELKILPNSWYYDDYTPQSAGMCDNAVLQSSGLYKLSCGGYIAADKVEELEGEPFGLAVLDDAVVTIDDDATYIEIATDINIPINCYIENGEFIVTLYNVNTSTAPEINYANNPMFTSARGENSVKANAYKYFFSLVNIENFYGFDHYYRDGKLVLELTNPRVLPDGDQPLAGKTIILDAGHGGANPGALGPLGGAEGALNESDLNLEIVMAAKDKLESLGANIVLTRDRETEIDVPINDRLDQLIEVDPDLCISIHQNSMPYSSDVTTIRGLVGLYWSDSGYMLTDVVGETMANAFGRLDRSPTKQRLAMVRNPKFPSTLIEVCFMTNVEEYERMMQPDAIDTAAESLAEGILNYYEAQRKYILD